MSSGKQILRKPMRPPVSKPPRVAVVGAGISGLACARTLQDHGLDVEVFDKGREVGGRMSTRVSRDGRTFDHGAQYFTAREEGFARYVRDWQQRGVVREWSCAIANLGEGRDGPPPESRRFVGAPGMNAVCLHLAEELDVRRSTRITALEQDSEAGWRLMEESGEEHAPFDLVVLALPPSQAAALLPGDSDLRARAESVRMRPCWAVMATLAEPLPVDYDGAFVSSGPLSWAARTSAKPGREPEPDRWVLHASPEWSERNLEAEAEWVAGELLAGFFRAAGVEAEAESAVAHRWRFALPAEPLADECLFDPEAGLGLCGDWCAGPRVEGAFLSGAALAGRILGRLGA